ncbi:DUF1513 domain-containing protein [uncultured Tateyamaria sp.]|uniref:DUF1513 domain-containing protein n=1 Tax=uncultured Tateyamaria sp. TaxID=455651 RepID=UPI00345A6075
MTSRRAFIASRLATGLAPVSGWADVGDPAFLSAGMTPNRSFVLCGLSTDGRIAFKRALPTRGHAAAAHPTRAEVVAFARRPGTFAIVLDCRTGTQIAQLLAPQGSHFFRTRRVFGRWRATIHHQERYRNRARHRWRLGCAQRLQTCRRLCIRRDRAA